jgi:cell division septation protein DedD
VAKAKPAKTVVTSSQATPSIAAKAVSKSQAIRQYALKHPGARPSEIAKALKSRGIDVDGRYVSKIRINARLKAKAVRAKPAASRPSKPVAAEPAITPAPVMAKPAEKEVIPVSDLRAAKEFVEQLGGLEQVQRVLALLAELTR